MKLCAACGNANWLMCTYCKEYDHSDNLTVRGKGQAAYHRSCAAARRRHLEALKRMGRAS